MARFESGYDYYNHYGSGWFGRFVRQNPEFQSDRNDPGGFFEFVIGHNRGDRDSGELQDIAHHEVLRLAAEVMEHRWKADNVYGPPTKANDEPDNPTTQTPNWKVKPACGSEGEPQDKR